MKSFMKNSALVFAGLIVFIMITGCTPGKAQTRSNDYAGSFESEDYEAFDRVDGNDDVIPPYKEEKKSDTSNKYARNDKKADVKSYRVKSSGDMDEGSDYEEESGKYRNRTESVSGEYEADDDSYAADERVSPEKFYQKGYASWYGREFHGKTTASGEKFDMNSLTAAHKTLPFGTIVEVKNLENGKSIKLTINDRGPYRGNRIIDLSYGAAREIDMVKKGEVKVGINVIKMGDNTAKKGNGYNDGYVEPVADDDAYYEEKPATKQRYAKEEYSGSDYGENYRLQAGAFYSRRNAERLKETIEGLTDRPVKIIQEGDYYKVRIEDIRSRREQDRIKDVLNSENIRSFGID